MLRRMAADLLAGQRRRAEQAVRRVVVQILLLTAAAVVALVGVGFLAVSLYLYFRGVLGAWQAGLVTGVIVILVSLLILAVSVGLRSRRPRPSPPPAGQSDTAAGLGKATAEMLAGANLRTGDAAMIALLAGVALGISAGRGRRGTSGSEGKKPD